MQALSVFCVPVRVTDADPVLLRMMEDTDFDSQSRAGKFQGRQALFYNFGKRTVICSRQGGPVP